MEEKNPWIGLESYKEGEILYGRDEDIRDLTQSVLSEKDVLLYGKSGIGKSSLLNAGVIPAARRHGYLPVTIRLSHKGEDTYLRQISRAIENAIIPIPTNEEGAFVMSEEESISRNDKLKKCIREVVACQDKTNESLYEYFHRHTFHSARGERIKLLILFDQFEEVFTLQSSEKDKKKFFSELADLLNDILPAALQQKARKPFSPVEMKDLKGLNNTQNIFSYIANRIEEENPEYVTDNDIHFVFTIREDFLSEFEYYSASIPSLKHNRYGLRPINEEQAAQIILRPIPELISNDVAKLIIETVTGRSDFKLDGIPEIEVDSAILSLYLNRLYDAKQGTEITADLVRQKGGEIISEFYLEAITGLKESTIEYLENNLLSSTGRRDNRTVDDAKCIGKVTESELDTLCNKKKILRQFNYAGELRVEYVHDILCPVVKAHRDERTQAKEQQRALREEKERREKLERKSEQERKKNRKRLTIAIGIIAVIVVALLGRYVLRRMHYSESYGNYTVLNGWPIGLGEQVRNKETKEKLIVYYKLTRDGLLPRWLGGKPFTKVEVIAANGEKATNQFVETPVVRVLDAEFDNEKARDFANLLKNTAYWIYTTGATKSSGGSKCTAFGLDNTVLYSIQYYRDDTYKSNDPDNKFMQWAVFYDANGKQMMITDNGIDRMRQTVDKGLVTSCLFFTEIGTPQKNAYGTYGYLYELDSVSQIKKQFKVDKYGNIDGFPTEFSDYKYGRPVKFSLSRQDSLYNIEKIEIEIEYEKGMQVYRFKDFSDTLIFNDNGRLTAGTFHPVDMEYEKIVYKYDDNARPLLNAKYKAGSDSLVESRIYTYDSAGRDSIIKVWQDGTGYVEKYERPDSTTETVSIWEYENDTVKAVKTDVDAYDAGYDIPYHAKRTNVQTVGPNRKDSITIDYFDADEKPVYKVVLTKDNLTSMTYIIDNKEHIISSEMFYYDEFGIRVARAVAGIDGTPVRCPNWDRNNACYYKMSVLYPFSDKTRRNMVSATAFNEFGELSYIQKGHRCMSVNEMPYNYSNTDYNIKTYKTFMAIATTDIYKGESNAALFLHLLSKRGTLYNAQSQSNAKNGLKDGDVLIKVDNEPVFPNNDASMESIVIEKLQASGGVLLIARPDPENGTYSLLKYKVPAGICGAELHTMNLTKTENDRLTSSIKQ